MRMSLMPAASTTARTAPPAITPVPGAAGFSRTRAGAELADDLVGDGGALQGNLNQVLLGVLNALADSVRHLAGLAQAEAHGAVAVADNDQCGELEDTAALHGLADAVDGDNRALSVPVVDASISGQSISSLSLELEAALAGAFGQLFDAAVVDIAAAVKNDLGRSLFQRHAWQSFRRPSSRPPCCRPECRNLFRHWTRRQALFPGHHQSAGHRCDSGSDTR